MRAMEYCAKRQCMPQIGLGVFTGLREHLRELRRTLWTTYDIRTVVSFDCSQHGVLYAVGSRGEGGEVAGGPDSQRQDFARKSTTSIEDGSLQSAPDISQSSRSMPEQLVSPARDSPMIVRASTTKQNFPNVPR